jgi:hypothetical protein
MIVIRHFLHDDLDAGAQMKWKVARVQGEWNRGKAIGICMIACTFPYRSFPTHATDLETMMQQI